MHRPGLPFGTTAPPRPTTLSARAAHRLAAGPLDAQTLMRDVCQVARLQPEAADRMALALLAGHPEFVHLPSGHWALAATPLAVAPPVAPPVAPSVAPAVASPASATSPRLTDIAFAVVDVETTGTRASSGDRITEIAIASVRDGAVIDVFSQLVNPERPIPPHITALTGIRWEMVRDQPCFRHIAAQVVERLAGAVFVAHNAAFDWRFVSEEVRRGIGRELAGPRLCTVQLARVLLPQLPRRSLDMVTQHFGIAIDARHRAAGDAVATAHALSRLLQLAADDGVRTWADLEQLVRMPMRRSRPTAADRRRRAMPHPLAEDPFA